MTKTLKLEVSVDNIGENGAIASTFATTEFVQTELNKKVNLTPEGKVDHTQLPDYTYITGLPEALEDERILREEAEATTLSQAKTYSDQKLSETAAKKADLIEGKVPFTQLPYNINLEQNIANEFIAVRDEIKQTSDGLVSQIATLDTDLTAYVDSKDTERKDYIDRALFTFLEDLDLRYNEASTRLQGEVDAVVAASQTKVDAEVLKLKKGETVKFDQDVSDAIGGYPLHARIGLDNGDVVKSTVAANTVNPNDDMTGWVKTNAASQIFDESGETQQSINDNLKINNLTDYKTTQELSDSPVSLRKASVNGILYQWDSESALDADGFYVVSSSTTVTGRWLQVNQNSYRSSLALSISGAFKAGKMIEVDSIISTPDTIPVAEDNIKIVGYGDSTGFVYTGVNGTETALNNLKPIIAAKRSSIANAISSLKVSDINVNMSNASNVCAIDGRYITNNSKFDGVSVNGIGINSIGFYISKQWYSRYIDCRARGVVANNRQGIGVYIDTTSDESTVNQVNAVPIDISVRELQYGILVNPARYIYSLIIPSSVTIEKCQVGLKVVGTDSAYIVRNAVISAYFEANDIDAEWGSSTDTRTLDQKITWLGCSFNDTGSKVILNQGQHEFIGCTGLETLIVNNTATVNIRNTLIDTITNNTGNARAVVNNIGANQSAGASQYGALTARSLKAVSLTATASVGTDPVTFDFLNISQTLFSGATPARGQKAYVTAFARRSYDTTTGYSWRGMIVRLSGGWYLVPDAGTWNITASIDSSGVLTLSSTGADTKYYDVVVQVF